jgi:hypothetical protein
VSKAPGGKTRGPAGTRHPPTRGDDRDGGTSGIAKALRTGVRQSERSRGARGVMPPSAHAHAHTPGHRRPEEAYAPGAALPGSQGTTAGRGTWWSEGAAGRHLRTTAGQAGTLPAGPGTPSPVPISLRLERLATQAQHYPDMACTTLAQHREVAMRERAFRRLTPPSAPGVDRVPWRLYQETLQTPRET